MEVDVRLYPLLALSAVVPVSWYLVGTSRSIVALSLVSVLVIATSVYLMFTGHVPGRTA